MEPAVAIGLVVVIAAFLGWWLWASRRRHSAGGDEPRDAWDALNRGLDPSEPDAAEPGAGDPDQGDGPG